MKKSASSGTNWKYATYFLEKSINMSIILRATRSKLGVGDIAVDDLKINRGMCPTISKYNNHFIQKSVSIIINSFFYVNEFINLNY